jgi:hypothetical protein
MQIHALVELREWVWNVLFNVVETGCRVRIYGLGFRFGKALIGVSGTQFLVRFPVGLLAIASTVSGGLACRL